MPTLGHVHQLATYNPSISDDVQPLELKVGVVEEGQHGRQHNLPLLL